MELEIIDDIPIDINIVSEEVGITSTNPIPIELFSTILELDTASLNQPVNIQLEQPTDFLSVNETSVTEVGVTWPDPLLLEITNYNNTSLNVTDATFTEVTATNLPDVLPVTLNGAITIQDTDLTTITASSSSFPATINVSLENTIDTLPVQLSSTILEATNLPDVWSITIGQQIQAGEPIPNVLDVEIQLNPIEIENPPAKLTIWNGTDVTEVLPVNLSLGTMSILNPNTSIEVSQTAKLDITADPFETSLAAWPASINAVLKDPTVSLEVETDTGESLITQSNISQSITALNNYLNPNPLPNTFLSDIHLYYISKYRTGAITPETTDHSSISNAGLKWLPLTNVSIKANFFIPQVGKVLTKASFKFNITPGYSVNQSIEFSLTPESNSQAIIFRWDDTYEGAATIRLWILLSSDTSGSSGFSQISSSQFNIDKVDGTGPSGLVWTDIRYSMDIITLWCFQDSTFMIWGFVYEGSYIPFHCINWADTTTINDKIPRLSPAFYRIVQGGTENTGFEFLGFEISTNCTYDHIKMKVEPIRFDTSGSGILPRTGWGGPSPTIKYKLNGNNTIAQLQLLQITSSSDILIRLHIAPVDTFNFIGGNTLNEGPIVASMGQITGSSLTANWSYTFYSGVAYTGRSVVIDVGEILDYTAFNKNTEIVVSFESVDGIVTSTLNAIITADFSFI